MYKENCSKCFNEKYQVLILHVKNPLINSDYNVKYLFDIFFLGLSSTCVCLSYHAIYRLVAVGMFKTYIFFSGA